MKYLSIALLIFAQFNLTLEAKTMSTAKRIISIPQNFIQSGNNLPAHINPRINPYFLNSQAYGNFLLNQYGVNINTIRNNIPSPQSDLGTQYLGSQMQGEITKDLSVQINQADNSLPAYRITNINDHGVMTNTSNPKFKNVDYLLWKFQDLEEGVRIELKRNQLIFVQAITVFKEKPDALLEFIKNDNEAYLLVQSRVNGVILGLIVKGKSKKATQVQCTRVENSTLNTYNFAVIDEVPDFKDYVNLFLK